MNEENLITHGATPCYEPGKGGLGFEIFRSLQIHKDKIAEYIVETGEYSTYTDLLVRSRRLALHLLSKNLKKEDVVCLCSYNQKNAILPFLASKFIDVGYASIEPTMPEEDLIYLFDYIKPKVLFVAEDYEEKIDKCLKMAKIELDTIIMGKSKKNTLLDDLLKPTPGEDNFIPVIVEDLKETAIIFLSSGTTGKPKGICCNHYSFLAQCVNSLHRIWPKGMINLSNYSHDLSGTNDQTETKSLNFAPLYWISGVTILVMSMVTGQVRVVGAAFNPDTAWDIIEKYKPEITFLPPGQVAELYFRRNKDQFNYNGNVFITGGGPVRSMHLEYIREMYPNATAIQIYAITEGTGIVCAFDVKDLQSVELQYRYPSSCGKISYGISWKIVDTDTEQICQKNQQGELRIKSKYIMNGYYKMDSSSAFDSEGWFKTGDLAFINEDNCLTIVDRIKEILLYTVYNIRPSIIEDILAQHPSVYESFVIGVPHIEDNQHPMGVVLLKEEYKNKVTSDEIIAFVNEKVPAERYKIRAGIRFVDEMMKTPTGKIRKLAMKALITEGKL